MPSRFGACGPSCEVNNHGLGALPARGSKRTRPFFAIPGTRCEARPVHSRARLWGIPRVVAVATRSWIYARTVACHGTARSPEPPGIDRLHNTERVSRRSLSSAPTSSRQYRMVPWMPMDRSQVTMTDPTSDAITFTGGGNVPTVDRWRVNASIPFAKLTVTGSTVTLTLSKAVGLVGDPPFSAANRRTSSPSTR
jgi:hypothetical protein